MGKADVATFEDIRAMCSDVETLPELPRTAFELVKELSKPEPNSREVEGLISLDPSLSGAILRAANSVAFNPNREPTTTIRKCVNVLGEQAIQDVAMAMMVSGAFLKVGVKNGFEPVRFARHSAYVGFLAKYFHSVSVRRHGFDSFFVPDEMFSVGILHELGLGLLSFAAPTIAAALHFDAAERRISVRQAFQELYGNSLNALAYEACLAWKFPPKLAEAICDWESGAAHPQHPEAYAVLVYADWTAETYDVRIHNWECRRTLDPEVVAQVGLDQSDVNEVIEVVSGYVSSLRAA